ncbi:MAG: DUF2269 family protein [bacterium]
MNMSISLYQLIKLLHLLGVILFIGNIIVTALWKLMADRTREPGVVAFGQRLVTITDLVFTGLGAGLIFVTGLTMAATADEPLWKARWLVWGFGLFTISGLIWVTALIPIQVKQSNLARLFAKNGNIPASYWRLGRLWMIFGLVATVLPLLNLYFMVFKPM